MSSLMVPAPSASQVTWYRRYTLPKTLPHHVSGPYNFRLLERRGRTPRSPSQLRDHLDRDTACTIGPSLSKGLLIGNVESRDRTMLSPSFVPNAA